MDTQTTSSHAESGDAVVCNDEAGTTEIAEGGDFLSVLFLKPRYHCDPCSLNERRQKIFSIIIIHSKYFPVSDWLKPHT